MGNKVVTFTDSQLEAYQDCTVFTRQDILRVFKRFREINPELIPDDMTGGLASAIKIPVEQLEQMPELKENPFKRRICEVFSDEGNGDMSFDAFLDMFSVFSEASSRDIKSNYAFRIYDFDGDNHLGKKDLEQTLVALTQNSLNEEEVNFVVNKVLEETDLDEDGMLSYVEFEHVISRAPEFLNTFHIRI